MTEEQLMMLNEVSILLGQIRKVTEQAAVIHTKYLHFEKNAPSEKNDQSEKNDPVCEKNRLLLKTILDELDIIQDVNILSRVRIKKYCQMLDPAVDL